MYAPEGPGVGYRMLVWDEDVITEYDEFWGGASDGWIITCSLYIGSTYTSKFMPMRRNHLLELAYALKKKSNAPRD